MEDFVYYNYLFDIYGSLLTSKEQETFSDYYHEDLSLSEIALDNSISRSAVQKKIKTVIDKLNYYESKLNLYKKYSTLRDSLEIEDISLLKNKIEEILEM